VPYRLLKAFHRVQQRLVRELEKKFSGKDVVLVANRRIMPKQGGGQSNARPRSRTLTAVRAAGPPCGARPRIAGGVCYWRLLGERLKLEGRACACHVCPLSSESVLRQGLSGACSAGGVPTCT